MAPLRSSRHTRHTDVHAASTRAGRNANDFDPTDGLPVRKYVLETVSVNQDAAAEATDPNAAASKANKDGFPWDEQPLPTFFDQLPAHNQELLRRSRAGERNTKCSVWDRKAGEWVRYEEARKRGLTGDIGLRKSRYLATTTNEDGEEGADAEDDEDDDDDEDDETDINGTADGIGGAVSAGLKKGKKRKQAPTQLLQDRTFEVKRWVQVPMDKADKMPEPKYLADRRPGMPSYYNQTAAGAWAQAAGYGAVLEGGGGPNYDLGDGSGLGSALGGPGPNAAGMETPPVRKNMPPRPRKKKGGPGRKKKEVVEAERRAAEEARRRAEALARGEVEEVKPEGDAEAAGKVNDIKAEEDGSGTPRSRRDDDDESEAEGSEEGEVNEDSGDRSGNATPTPTPGPTPVGAGSTAAPLSSGLLNAPIIPSSLRSEVAGTDEDVAMTSAPSAEPTLAGSIPPSLDAQMMEAPTAPLDASTVPPPSAEPSIPETLTEAPAPTATPPIPAVIDTAAPPPPSDPDAAPIASPLSVVDPVDFPPTAATSATAADATGPVESSNAESAIQGGKVNVPFDHSAEAEVAPLTEGVEIRTAEQTDSAVVAAEHGAGVAGDVMEAAAQGEVAELVNEEAGVTDAMVEGAKDTDVGAESSAVSVKDIEEKKRNEAQEVEATGGFDLLGGLEKAVADQESG